ncbi:GNAT family N-acetyltransferase [Candidatus Woesearchaeota archaeon]|nr:GNAT family N-acetyltransferase [Candidatus Woesearchaeota archaeon]
MAIKEAELSDIPKIVDLWIEFMKEHDNIIFNENPGLKEFEIKDKNIDKSYWEFLKFHIESPDGAVFIAKENKEIAGYTLIFIKDEIPIYKNKKIGYISDLFVKKDFRSRALSSKLRDESIKWFEGKGIEFIALSMYPSNKLAHSIYKGWGFIDYKMEMRKKINNKNI